MGKIYINAEGFLYKIAEETDEQLKISLYSSGESIFDFMFKYKNETDVITVVPEVNERQKINDMYDEYIGFAGFKYENQETLKFNKDDIVISGDEKYLQGVKDVFKIFYSPIYEEKKKTVEFADVVLSNIDEIEKELVKRSVLPKSIKTSDASVFNFVDIRTTNEWYKKNRSTIDDETGRAFVNGLFNLIEDYATMSILDEIFTEEDRESDYYYSGVPVLLENSVIPIMTSFSQESIIDMGFALFAQGGKSNVHNARIWANICKFTMARYYMPQEKFIDQWIKFIEDESVGQILRDDLHKFVICEHQSKSIEISDEHIHDEFQEILKYKGQKYGDRILGPILIDL